MSADRLPAFQHRSCGAPGADPEILERGPVRGRSPEPSAEGATADGGSRGTHRKNFEKLDAISCNLAYIFGIRMA